MKKNLFLFVHILLVFSIMTLGFTGCNRIPTTSTEGQDSDTSAPPTSTERQDSDTSAPSYAFSYPDSYLTYYVSGGLDNILSSAPSYNGALTNPNKVQDFVKENMPGITIEIYGKTVALNYRRTRSVPLYPFEYDTYTDINSSIEYSVVANTQEFNKIFIFDRFADQIEFTPIFDSTASDQDYIDYVSAFLSETTGIDHRNYVATVRRYSEIRYAVDFQKYVNGIPCRGMNSVLLTPEGLVTSVSLGLDESSYSRLDTIQIDLQEISEVVQQRYASDTSRYTVLSCEQPAYLWYIEEDTVWLNATISFRYEGNTIDPVSNTPDVFLEEFLYMLPVATIVPTNS